MRTFTRRHLLQSAAAVLAVGCQAEAPELTREVFLERRAQVHLRVCVFDVQGRGFGQGVFA